MWCQRTLCSYCRSLSLDPALASGAILVCPYSREAEGEVVRVGAAGVIFLGSGSGSTSFALPATVVSGDVGLLLRNYVEGTPNPSALILPTEAVLDNKPAPVVAAFSSRGPSVRNPDILKVREQKFTLLPHAWAPLVCLSREV